MNNKKSCMTCAYLLPPHEEHEARQNWYGHTAKCFHSKWNRGLSYRGETDLYTNESGDLIPLSEERLKKHPRGRIWENQDPIE